MEREGLYADTGLNRESTRPVHRTGTGKKRSASLWIEHGHCASRPPGELHGLFRTDVECIVLEVSFPNRFGNAV